MTYRQLSEDPELASLQTVALSVTEEIHQVLGGRDHAIRLLKRLKSDVEESYDKSRKARIAGTTASVVGSAISIVGFGIGFVTFGAGFGLAIAGGVLAGAGGITTAGSEIGYYAISKGKLNAARTACKMDREKMMEVNRLAEQFNSHLESLTRRHSVSVATIFREIGTVKNAGAIGYKAYKIGDSAFEACKTVYSLVKTGTPAARTAWVAASTATKVVAVVGVVFDVAFIPVDLAVMIKSAYDVHQYKANGRSNSNVAEEIQNLIDKLEANKAEIEQVLNAE